MKLLFYAAILLLILLEIANVYYIMPMPGSQETETLDTAYFLYNTRWIWRTALALLALFAWWRSAWRYRWLPLIPVLLLGALEWMVHFNMAADTMFYQPSNLVMADAAHNSIDTGRLVIGVAWNGEARAYPIQFLGYHHQVRDSVGGKPIMVTYCTVCRTGRVYEPLVDGRPEEFRLVGMDHYNAMFEDKHTRSWWRQVSGEAVAGPLKGRVLPEVPYTQTSLSNWLVLHPDSKVMQPDALFQVEYDSMSIYENGRPYGRLTRRDTASWQNKSWVVGVRVGNAKKAYDWNELLRNRILYDVVGGQPLVVVLMADNKSFAALQCSSAEQRFEWRGDTLASGADRYNLLGESYLPGRPDLEKLPAYQEYWHSWQTFNGAQ